MLVKQSKIKILFYLITSLTFLITVLRTVSIITVFESDIGYYERGAILPTVQQTLIFCSVIFVIAFCAIIKKSNIPNGSPTPTHFSVFSSFLCGTLQISSAILLLLYQRGTIAPITVMILLGFTFATAYFFYDALCPPEKKSPLCIIPAMAAAIGLVAVIVKVHVDYTSTLNNPNKTLIFITFATVALFIVQELRFIVGRPQPKLYLATASIALMLCAALSIPGIIGHYTNVLSGGDFLIYYMVAFGYGVYIFIRLFLYTRYCSFGQTFAEVDAPNTAE